MCQLLLWGSFNRPSYRFSERVGLNDLCGHLGWRICPPKDTKPLENIYQVSTKPLSEMKQILNPNMIGFIWLIPSVCVDHSSKGVTLYYSKYCVTDTQISLQTVMVVGAKNLWPKCLLLTFNISCSVCFLPSYCKDLLNVALKVDLHSFTLRHEQIALQGIVGYNATWKITASYKCGWNLPDGIAVFCRKTDNRKAKQWWVRKCEYSFITDS